MKKLLFVSFAILIVGHVFAQSAVTEEDRYGKGKMPFNDNGEVVFSTLAKAEGYSAEQIYNAAKIFIVDAFKSANDVIQLDDKANNVIIAKGWHKGSEGGCRVNFTMKIQTRENRYKIDVYQLVGHKDAGYTAGMHIPAVNINAEELTDEVCFKPNGKIKRTGKGFWRREVIDCALLITTEAQLSIMKNLISGTKGSVEDNW